MMGTVETAIAVERFLVLPFFFLGLSHLVQPKLWRDFFVNLVDSCPGNTAVVYRTFMLELWPATAVVVFHQVWSGPGLVLTLYGHALMLKCILALLYPSLGMRSLEMARTHGERGFMGAGIALIGMSALCLALQLHQ